MTTSTTEGMLSDLEAEHWPAAANHLKQAADAFERGHLEAANGQVRSFLEALCNDIATAARRGFLLRTFEPSWSVTGGEARRYLESSGLLCPEDGQFLKSFFAILHSKGSHAGATNTTDSRRRLEVAVAIGRFLLETFRERSANERTRRDWMEEWARPLLGPFGFGSTVGGFRSTDFHTASVFDRDDEEDRPVLIEFVYGWASSFEPTLDANWITDFDNSMEDVFESFDAIILTSKPLANDFAQLDTGVATFGDHIVVIHMVQADPSESLRRVGLAKAWLAAKRDALFSEGE